MEDSGRLKELKEKWLFELEKFNEFCDITTKYPVDSILLLTPFESPTGVVGGYTICIEGTKTKFLVLLEDTTYTDLLRIEPRPSVWLSEIKDYKAVALLNTTISLLKELGV